MTRGMLFDVNNLSICGREQVKVIEVEGKKLDTTL